MQNLFIAVDPGFDSMKVAANGKVFKFPFNGVDENMTESDTRHAMANVNQLVAAAVRDKRPDINHYAVEYLTSKDEGLLRYMENGKAAMMNLNDLRAEKLGEVCGGLIEYLNQKYNHLLDFKYVLVTGGAGACFYPQMLDYYRSANLLDKDHFLLASGILNQKEYPIEFSIVIGAYKGLRGILS